MSESKLPEFLAGCTNPALTIAVYVLGTLATDRSLTFSFP